MIAAMGPFKETSPFQGWPSLRRAGWVVGPLRALRWLLARVHAEIEQQDGTFRGDGIHNYANHPLAARMLLRLLLDRPVVGAARGNWQMDPCGEHLLASMLRQMNTIAGERTSRSRPADYDHAPTLSRAHVERVAELLWLETLRERGHSYATTYEVARAWLMLRKYWPACRERVGGAVEHRLRDPLDTAFDSLEHALFLSIALFVSRGIVDDAARAFQNVTFRRQLTPFLSWYVPDAQTVVGSWGEIEGYADRAIESCFHDEPILRIDDKRLVAPDLGLLLPGVATRAVTRALVHYAGQDAHVLECANTVLGFVFERYVAQLVEECALQSGARFEPEFKLVDKTESPDAIIVDSGKVMLFEAKVTRYPWPLEQNLSPSSFIGWLRKVSGERTKGRGPLDQGARFIDKWTQGDAECVDRLGVAAGSFRYLIVTIEDLPPFLPWERFRDEFWRPLLSRSAQALDRQTMFVSVRDLEALVETVIALKKRMQPRTVEQLLQEWSATWSSSAHVVDGNRRLKPSLKGFLVEKYAPSSEDRPAFISAAFAEAWSWAESMLR